MTMLRLSCVLRQKHDKYTGYFRSFYMDYRQMHIGMRLGFFISGVAVALLIAKSIRRMHYKVNRREEVLKAELRARGASEDFRCYNVAKQYRYECANTEAGFDEKNMHCMFLVSQLEDCKRQLYDFIPVDKTPAMLPVGEIMNKPLWVRGDDVWFAQFETNN
ncbi:unnamed protein product [Vitrella brassicaformis CCMP3155]|uniref:Uncharacterized protein n=1 Tax=Vitrella brassicaformis (strain CCMP3155) TaxID=1169540 RepID=A0A0G4ETX7_VITBC|nr:unnamed protein product [Vitrella brassicaformis CCMP3155]|eukprot:CEM01777.1 unnamed protein product [Vitrella brassicaformis CCMP3155]